MRILYYLWNEIADYDMMNTLRGMGHQLSVVSERLQDYDHDEDLMELLERTAKTDGCEYIYTFNYFPLISKVANSLGIPYISWVFDSPHLTLSSKTVSNPCNRIFVFDRALYRKMREQGITHVYHQPLAVNVNRIKQQFREHPITGYEHEVTFLGSMYDDEKNFYNQMRYMPEKLRGYIEGVMEAQMRIWGCDMIGDLLTGKQIDEFLQYAKFDLGKEYFDVKEDWVRDTVRKKITEMERFRFLKGIGEYFQVDLYSKKCPTGLPVKYMGYADYNKEMHRVFATSKINLNITLRSIITGIPLRVVDIMGAGGFLITNYQEELTDYFVNGEDLVWFDDIYDLGDKIDYYLKNEDERNRIARNGQQKMVKEFSYETQVTKILKTVEAI